MKGEEKLSTQYNDAVKQIKTAILQSQAKAFVPRARSRHGK